jgi:sirohydrochlorin ferrochelatase
MSIPSWLSTLVLLGCLLPGVADAGRGLLLLAHGTHSHGGQGDAASSWNRNVETLAAELDTELPTEVAFGMANPESIQAAIDRLERRGVREIATVPLFVSSHSPIIDNFRYILGLRDRLAETTSLRRLEQIQTTSRVAFTAAMDDHPLIGGILLDRALALTQKPGTTHVVLIAHGPNDPGEDRQWLQNLEAHAALLRKAGGFRSTSVLTHRNDAPPEVKSRARAAFRQMVAEAGRAGEVIVLPVLLSAGGIEQEVKADLEGLSFRFAAPLMPHPNIRRWVEAQLQAAGFR